MSMTETAGGASSEVAGYGGFADAIGGIATVVLAIIGLSGNHPTLMLSIVTIIFGASLLIQGGAMLSEYAHVFFPTDVTSGMVEQFSGGSLSSLFLVGAAGIVLGVLALVGIHPTILSSAAVIAFGAAFVLTSNAVTKLHRLKFATERAVGVQTGNEILAGEVASGSAGVQAIAGLAAVVLGILAVAGHLPATLALVALLVLGAALVLSGSSLSYTVLSFMRPSRNPEL